MNLKNNRVKTYVTSRAFGGYKIPVPIQTLALRDYCTHQKLLFSLPPGENIFPNSYMVLSGIIKDLKGYSGLLMCSMHMLPINKNRRKEMINRILEQDVSLHFVLERIVVNNQSEAKDVEMLLNLSSISATDKSISELKKIL